MLSKKNFLFYLLLFLSLCACGKNPSVIETETSSELEEGCPEEENLGDALAAEIFPLVELPSRVLSINLTASQFTNAQKTKIDQAILLLEKVVNSYEFKDKVLNHQYQGQRKFASSELSNEAIYAKIMAGKEQLSLVEDNTLNLEIRPYYSWRSVVAYTTKQSHLVYFNTKFLNYYSPHDVAKTLMHEWLHKIGFEHDFSATNRRPYSVPYGIGEIVKTLAKAP